MLILSSSHLLSAILIACSCLFIDAAELYFTSGSENDKLTNESEVSLDHYGYCNHHESVNGHEGEILNGHILEQVHAVLSPGETDMSMKVKVLGHSSLPRLCDTWMEHQSSAVTNFVQMTDVYKEITRNVHLSHMHSTFPPSCSDDHLTLNSLQTLISIGKLLSTSYFDATVHDKLKAKYSHVHVESIQSQNAYHSMLAFLHGFLSNKQIYKTKIHLASKNFCELLESNLTSCQCSKVNELAPYLSRSLSKGTFMFKDVIPDIDKISQLLQVDIGDVSALELFHLFMQYKCDNKIPVLSCDSDKNLCHMLDNSKLSSLHNILANSSYNLKTDLIFRTFSELRTYPFLQRLMSRADLLHKHHSVNVYMGGKQFLEFLTTSLGIQIREVTPAISRLVFEFYRKSSTNPLDKTTQYLRVLYNGVDVTKDIRVCSHLEDSGLCSVQNFRQEVHNRRIQYLDQC